MKVFFSLLNGVIVLNGKFHREYIEKNDQSHFRLKTNFKNDNNLTILTIVTKNK